ncbi:diacylglycerol/polyprenol kinase family protein [Trichocoleus sp. FACHB-262]|uniref:diacylglycerol/polyprenol kinase family protein n=1 Tax=Trichocoleus sp. FACHB-262 TaxID=2692869 RepID=UPI001685C2A5|nr:diacylglycerol/polyprenol kinase family protein [Trichocoleus sp. FACHB-262]MBD2124123.1 phosphatidate cytidylyltransferase [Trichocoleus sp. FACHB-262]
MLTEVFSLVSPPSFWVQLTVVGIWLSCVVLLAEWLGRYTETDAEIVRKVVHIGVGNVILLAWWLQIPAWMGITASVLASAIAFTSYYVPILASMNSVGRKSWGTFFYAISIGVLIAWFWPIHQPQYAALGILVMTWGDGLAALIGRRFGRHPYHLWDMQKSWEGSLTMAGVSYVVSSAILLGVQGNTWQTWCIPLAVALVAAGLEAFSKFGIDNLTVPIVSGALSFLLSKIL